jgi:hypothetical protein
LNEPRYRLDGELSRGDLRGRVEFTGPCKSLQQNHPPFMKQARVDGTIDGAADFHFSLPEPERSRSLADKRFPLFLSFADGIQSVCVRQTDPLQAFPEICPDLDGSFQLQNAEISFAMLPVRLTEANGALHLTNNGVHYQGAKLKAGGYPAVASGEYLFSHEGHREFRFDMKADDADLTPWYGPWPKRPKPGAPRSSSSARQPYLRAVIKGDVHAGQSKLRQFNFRSHSGSVFFEQWDNADNRLRLDNIAIEAYQGTAKAHGRFRFAQGRKPSWDFDIEAAGMEIQELLSDLNRRPIDSSGRLSGKVKLAGVGGDPKSVTGEGKLMVRDARLSGPGLFAEIRKMLGIESWTRAAAPEIEGDFIVKDGYVQSDNVEMGSELAKLSATGKVWFNSHIDLVIAIRPLSILGDIPLVEYLSKFTDAVARSLLKFHASGPAGNPEVKPIPFSADIIFPRALEGKSAASSSTAAQEAPQPQ